MTRGPTKQIVGRSVAGFIQEHVTEARVVVLARLHKHVVAERIDTRDDLAGPHELEPRAKYGDDPHTSSSP